MTTKRSLAGLALALIGLAALGADPATSPYAGLESRDIKALSDGEMDSLRSGQGMGFGLAAELNAFPGPKHVLDLAQPLELNEKQLRQTAAVFDRMHADAVRLGQDVIEGEQELERLFASGTTDRESLRDTVLRVGQLRAALRYVHLAAHVDMREILTAEQVRRYDALRGYEHRPAEDCPHKAP